MLNSLITKYKKYLTFTRVSQWSHYKCGGSICGFHWFLSLTNFEKLIIHKYWPHKFWWFHSTYTLRTFLLSRKSSMFDLWPTCNCLTFDLIKLTSCDIQTLHGELPEVIAGVVEPTLYHGIVSKLFQHLYCLPLKSSLMECCQ